MKLSSVLSPAAAAVLALTSLTACDSLKEAMSAHVDTVARVGSEELSVDQLATLVNEFNMPPQKELASAVANTWIDLQLLARVAATGDTVVSDEAIDKALWFPISNMKVQRFYQEVVKGRPSTADSAMARRAYADGAVLAASHILILTREKPADQHEALRRRAEELRAQATAANFAELARKYSEDKGSAQQGGSLGLFPRGVMVAPFENAVVALKPGEISPIVQTEYGYHIIRRATFEEVNGPELAQAAEQRAAQIADSVYLTGVQTAGKLEVKPNIASVVRTVLSDPTGNTENKTVLATSAAGKFTAGRLAEWLSELPPQQVYQQRMQLANAPDSMTGHFVKSFVTNELVLRAADSAKVAPSAEEMAALRQQFRDVRASVLMQLGLDAKTLGDSVKGGESDRELYAAKRVNLLLARMAKGEAPPVDVPPPIARALRNETSVSLNNAGLDRAVERATKLHAAARTADSLRRAQLPQSAVPMPGSPSEAAGQAGAAQDTPQH